MTPLNRNIQGVQVSKSFFAILALAYLATAPAMAMGKKASDPNWLEQHSFAITDPAQYRNAYTALVDHMQVQSHTQAPHLSIFAGPFLVKDGSDEQIGGIVAGNSGSSVECFELIGASTEKPLQVDCAVASKIRDSIQLPSAEGLALTDQGKKLLASLPKQLDSKLDNEAGATVLLSYFVEFAPDLSTLTIHSEYQMKDAAYSDMGVISPFQGVVSRIDQYPQKSSNDPTRFRVWFAVHDPNLTQGASLLTVPVVSADRWAQKSWASGVGAPVIPMTSYYLDLEISSKSVSLDCYSLLPMGPVPYNSDNATEKSVEIPL
jgi:hypothetical protein